MNISKIKVLDVMGVCRCRKEAGATCTGCMYYGTDCIEAHDYSYRAVNILTKMEVDNDKQPTDNRGTRL